ncbi:MAG: FG-GAP repeat protein [Verrucomicrobiota bacterium]
MRYTISIACLAVFIVGTVMLVLLFFLRLNPGSGDLGPAEAPVAATIRISPDTALESTLLLDKHPLRESASQASMVQPAAVKELQGTDASSLPQTEQQSLWKAFSEARREIRPLTDHQRTFPENEGVHFFASNPRNQINARFADGEVRLESGYAGQDWQTIVSLQHQSGTQKLQEIRQQGSQIEYVYDGIVEWYDNKPEGIEHGFVIQERPASASEEGIRLDLNVEGFSVEALEGREPGSDDLQFVDEQGLPRLAYKDLKVWDANGEELDASMVSTAEGVQIVVADGSAVYPIVVDPLIVSLEEKLGLVGSMNHLFGASLDVDGNTVLISAFGDNQNGINSGSVYVFVNNGAEWVQETKLIALDGKSGDAFGYSVSLSGDVALIGASGADDRGSNSGSAYIFMRDGSSWNQVKKISAGDGESGDRFGTSVSIDDDTALIGAYRDDDHGNSSGSAYVFVRSDDIWGQEAKLTAGADGVANDWFGFSVDLDSSKAVIGAPRNDALAGSVYIFKRNQGVWNREARLAVAGNLSSDRFGWSVGMDGSSALIGATADDGKENGSGAAYVYVYADESWSLQAKLTANDGRFGYTFGSSISLKNNIALVGSLAGTYWFSRNGNAWDQIERIDSGTISASISNIALGENIAFVGDPGDDENGDESGSVYVYALQVGMWNKAKKLTTGTGTSNDLFGYSVSLDGDTALVGAYGEDDNGSTSGSAYVLARNGNSWVHEAKLLPGDGAPDDWFGFSVSLSGQRALVSAHGNDDAGDDSGSAYLFERVNGIWIEQCKLVTSDGQSRDYFGRSVSLDDDTALIGAYGDDDNGSGSGSAYVFTNVQGSWNREAKLIASDGSHNDEFGRAVSFNGVSALIGARRDNDNGNDSGSAYVFINDKGIWSEEAKLTANDGARGDEFGISVSIDGDTALVGAHLDDENASASGSAYIFIRSGNLWTQEAKLTASDGGFQNFFGNSVSINKGGIAIVGADKDNEIGSNSGSAYLFVHNGNAWEQEIKFTAPDGRSGDRFGVSVSLGTDTAFIGSYRDDDAGYNSGSVYVYRFTDALEDADGDGATAQWELDNGFDPFNSNDLYTLDSDSDGDLDILEIFQGTSKTSSSSGYGLQQTTVDASESNSLKTQIRRSTGATGLVGQHKWSPDLVNWYVSGQNVGGVKVDITESIVESHPGYEIVEVTLTPTIGSPDRLFYRLELVVAE